MQQSGRKIDRRRFLGALGAGAASLPLLLTENRCSRSSRLPNIIFILADDLGYGEVGCYGQTRIRTPNIDRLAAAGIRFMQFYSGSPVCAPSRCVLLTGQHTGHAYIRDNDEMGERGDVWHDLSLEGQRPLLPGTSTIGTFLQDQGYATAAIGKWGLGGPGSSGEPNRQGFDLFYGYLCQRIAHNYYPTYLWRNGEKQILEGNTYFYPHQKFPMDKDPGDREAYKPYMGRQYSMDLMTEEALTFIKANRSRPFFLYFASAIPHAALQVPEDSLKEYEGAFPETPYLGDKGYLPHPTPRAAYAAMVTRLDREVGRIAARLDELGIGRNTLVMFSSDNGPTFNGGTDSAFFRSAGPLRGLKASLYEGGIRIPFIARWPGRIRPGSVSSHAAAFWDVLPTLGDILGLKSPPNIDGVSFLPTLLGHQERQAPHDTLYWEYSGGQAVRFGDWKAVRVRVDAPIELYNLKEDIGEKHDVAAERPDITEKIKGIMTSARIESDLFPLKGKRVPR